jgi:hypothetical protein
MKALQVEFVKPRRVWPALLSVVAAALFAVAAHQSWQGWSHLKQSRLATQEIAQLQAALSRQRAPQADSATASREVETAAYAQDAIALTKLAAFDVAGVLATLESTKLPGIKVASLEIVTAEQTARVELEVADPTVLLQYLEKLNAGHDSANSWKLTHVQSASGTIAGSAVMILRMAHGS